MAISDNIKNFRHEHGLTQKELADIAGVTNKAVSAWESGINLPQMGAIENIAKHFGITKSEIIEDKSNIIVQADNSKSKLRSVARMEEADLSPEDDEAIRSLIDIYLKAKNK